MAVTFDWTRGTARALAEAIEALDARLTAQELLTSGGIVVSATAVVATATVPTHWVQDAIPAVTVAATVTVPTPTVRGGALHAATTVVAPAAIPAFVVSAASVGVTPATVPAPATMPAATVTVP